MFFIKINDHKWLRNLGPEPMSSDFSAAYLHQKLKTRKSSIKAALMDQTVVAGLGNIYVLEALWHSRISPLRKAKKVREFEINLLEQSIRKVLKLAIEAGGTSLQDFRQVGGEIGYFQRRLNVYGCFNKKCKNIDCFGIVQRVKQLGRASYFCNSCQH